MGKIIVNKSFNKNYLVKSIEVSLSPDCQNRIDRKGVEGSYNILYNDGKAFDTSNLAQMMPGMFFVVTEDYLNLIDKFNTLLYEGKISQFEILGSGNFNETMRRNFNTITAYNKSNRMRVFNRMLTLGYITEEERTIAEKGCEAFGQIKYDSISWTYNEQFDYYTMKHSTPLNLETRWTNTVNNPDSKQLYLMTILPSSDAFNNYGTNAIGVLCSGTKFYREDVNKEVYQLAYMAHTLTDRSGDGDIQFDYIDKIDYLDSLELSIKLPKVIS